MVPEIADLLYEERLARLGLTTLEQRRLRDDMIQAYKIAHGIDTVKDGHFLQFKSRENQPHIMGQSLKLSKFRYKTTQKTFLFNIRIVNCWNSLLDQVVMSQSVNSFKNAYKYTETKGVYM